jgi:hypothetical protein|tara:strand:+ start:43 stop:366 length:324 start_codon:yes stop_codon:yes gene_type:complete
MIGNKSKAKVEEKDREDDDGPDRSEILGNLVKVAVLIWSASLLTFSYVRLPNGQKILDFDPTFIASVFSGSLAAFGLSPAKSGGGNGKTVAKKEPEVVSAIEPKNKS